MIETAEEVIGFKLIDVGETRWRTAG